MGGFSMELEDAVTSLRRERSFRQTGDTCRRPIQDKRLTKRRTLMHLNIQACWAVSLFQEGKSAMEGHRETHRHEEVGRSPIGLDLSVQKNRDLQSRFKKQTQNMKYLLCYHGSPSSDHAIDELTKIIDASPTVYVWVGYKIELPGTLTPEVMAPQEYLKDRFTNNHDALKAEAENLAQSAVQKLVQRGVPEDKIHRIVEAVADVGERIVETSKENDIDTVLIGSHELNFIERLIFGSISEHVSQNAKCTVVLCK
ncbi:UspA domain-containing protein [Planoprotostelium fungivorum]|uniref:UspA domain-containing protein n=1 Tax=Planoprotostelium fungivorum TaxID=1890364 RepID=A0A2P6NSX5_9EUKA|nr:UspA domain-containing protein [Planoprotostelium fungivorum]PRP86988.1 UspA domain-containing protein [Planoprotostelium fungivorum]